MDNFFRNLFKANKREASTDHPAIGGGRVGVPASTADTTDYAKKQLEGHGGSFEENIVPVQSPRMALAISAVYRAIELRAKTIGQMQLQYQRLDREGGNFVMDVSNSDRYQSQGTKINYLLQVEPNPITTAATLWEQVTIDRLQRGNGFVYIERDTDTDEPIALWRATCGGYNMGLGTYNLTWFSDRGERSRANIPARDVLHFPNTFKEENGFWGIPTLRYAFDTLTLIKTQKAQALENAAKGGRVKLLISEGADSTVAPISAGRFDPKEAQAYAKQINREIYQQDVVALQNLSHIQNISMNAQDMQLMEQLNMGLDDVARFYATPRPLLMLDTNSHYNDYTNATMEYLQRTIAPDAVEIENECNRKLLSVYDFGRRRFHLCEQPLLRMDKKAQAEVDEKRLRTGTATVNELRKQYDMPAVKDGDIVYVITNLAELGSPKLRDVAGGGRPTTQEPAQQPQQQPATKEVKETA